MLIEFCHTFSATATATAAATSQKRSDKINPSVIEAQLQRREEDEKADNAGLFIYLAC